MSELLDKWISATAWAITPPKAYGPFHLCFTIIGIAVCFLLAKRLASLSEKGNRRLLLSVGIFLIVTEIYKQLFYFYYLKGNNYDWGIFPFHLCSIPMYLCTIAPLLKSGRIQQSMYSFMMLYNLLGGGIAFAEPSGLLHPYLTLTIHAMVWHMLLVFVGFYLVFSGRGGSEISNYKSATKTFLVLCGIAFMINFLLQETAGANINMFFVGPGNSTIIVFKQISEIFGWFVSTALYIPVVCLGAYLLFLIIKAHHARINNAVKQKC